MFPLSKGCDPVIEHFKIKVKFEVSAELPMHHPTYFVEAILLLRRYFQELYKYITKSYTTLSSMPIGLFENIYLLECILTLVVSLFSFSWLN